MKKSFTMYRLLTSFVLFMVWSICVQSQMYPDSYYEKINPEVFRPSLMAEVILSQLNKHREDLNIENLFKHDILEKAADDQALYMATIEEATLKNKGNKKTTADRMKLYGGTHMVEEIVAKANCFNGKEPRTYLEVAEEIVSKWIMKKKTLLIIDNQKYIFAGVGAVVDYNGKKVYVSAVFGNHYSFNAGSKLRNSMDVPYTTKRYGLKPYDDKICKRCKKFENIEQLHKALSVKDGKVYFHYNDNIKAFRKLIRNPKDGFAIDIVQKNQYNCIGDNIVDYNLITKGVLLKPIFAPKIYKKNMIPGEKLKDLMVVIGTIPDDIKGEYELNLLVIQDKHVCKTITKTYVEGGDVDYFNPLELIPDTVSIPTEEVYVPKADTNTLYFIVPFEKGKYEYKPEDIEPLITALKKPDFIILELTIAAYSSIEGSDETNLMLQKKRAESIVNALKSRQKDNFISQIKTDYAWENFKNDILATKYSFLADKTMEEAKEYIKSHNLLNELEPILAKHRYAEIFMTVTYDIQGNKEQAFVVDKFNRTITKDDIPFAFSIQKYIINKVVEKIYSASAATNMNIPEENRNAPFLINKLYLEKIATKNKLNDDYCDRINTLHLYAPNNPYILYNKTCCDVFHCEFETQEEINKLQNKIDQLYNTKIEKKIVDQLNLDFQFKMIKYLDTTAKPSPTVQKAFEKIKTIVNLDENDWKNSLELAQLFIKYKDFNFAIKLLDPLVDNPEVSEEFLFTYVSLCSLYQPKLMSNKFSRALERASKMNPRRYCELFKGDKFSFQVFDNPYVKDYYCKTCVK